VLLNDTGLGDTPLTLSVVATPTRGTVVLNNNGSYTYTPFLNDNGTDTFTYVVTDSDGDEGGQPACGSWPAPPGCPATVRINIVAVNDPPIAVDDPAVGDPPYVVDEDSVLPLLVAAPGVLANDADTVEGTALTAVHVSGPANGVLVLNSDGSFSYTPNANFRGTDSFAYQALDSGIPFPPGMLSNVATVTITVNPLNDTPVASDDAYTGTEDTPLNVPAPGVLTNDSGLGDTPVTVTLEGASPPGTLTLNADGSFTYTPPLNFFSPPDITFDYRVTDFDVEFAIATVTIDVQPANDPPVALDDSATTPEDTPVAIDVLANDSDPDPGDTLSIIPGSISDPANGTATFNDGGTPADPTDDYIDYDPDFNYFNFGDPDTFT
jgi:VCBS repeat-containing protein